MWIGRGSERRIDCDPGDSGLGPESAPLFKALGGLFADLGQGPAPSGLRTILAHLQLDARTPMHLRLSLFGRAEGMDPERLKSAALEPWLGAVVAAAQALPVGEHIELGGDRASWGASNGGLAYIHHLVEVFQTLDGLVGNRGQPSAIVVADRRRVQAFVDHCGVAEARGPNDAAQGANGDGRIDTVQVGGIGAPATSKTLRPVD